MAHSYRFANVEVLPIERQLLVGGRPVPLGSRAFDLLVVLIEHRSRLVTKPELLDAVWPGLVVGENNLQAQVSALRRLIGADSVKTVSGLGYRFAAPLLDEPANGAAHALAAPRASSIRLDPAAQSRVDLLSVFAGAIRVEAAADVLQGAVEEVLAMPQVERLPSSPVRLRLPEESRLAGRDRLQAAGKMAEASKRHGTAMAAIARAAVEHYWSSRDEATWQSAYRWDYDDFEAALQKACERKDAAVAAPVAWVLARLDLDRDTSRMRARKEGVCDLLRYTTDPAVRAELCWVLTTFQSVSFPQMTYLEAAIELEAAYRAIGPVRNHYLALTRLGNAYAYTGQFEAMESAFRSAHAVFDPGWPARVRWHGAFNEANARQWQEDAPSARAAAQGMLRVAAEMGDEAATARARHALAKAALVAGDLEGAIAAFEANLQALREAGVWRVLGLAHCYLCGAYILAGDVRAATAIARKGLTLVNGIDAFHLLDRIAQLAVRSGRFHEGALLLGHGDATRDWKARPNAVLGPQATWEAANGVQRALGPHEHARLRRMGREMTHDQVNAVARELLG